MEMVYSNRKTRIQRICGIDSAYEKDLYEKGRMLLEIYRDICWNAWQSANDVRELIGSDLSELGYASDDMDRALVYLETFAPDRGRDEFEERIKNLFETSWLIDIIEAALNKVREFPVCGQTYYDILNCYYINREMRTEAEILELLCMERSSFYRKKKEAIIVFGFAVWGPPGIRNECSDPEQGIQLEFTLRT